MSGHASRLAASLLRTARLALAGLFIVGTAAQAQTSVSGAITVATHWTTAAGPYVVTGDVVVQNGAVLTIDPGVTVYMGANTSLTVQAGGIQALGTTPAPIRVLSDKTRLSQPAAAGDWKQWVFNAGTVNTRLEHMLFQHGSGLAVKGSAPVFNYVDLRNHQGAAITVDLAASPTGTGLSASGCTVNGIAVPAGDITGSVNWGLRGIPYVAASGVVSVGASPTVVSVSPNTIQQGDTVTMTVTGTRLTGLTAAGFTRPGLTAQVLAGGTSTQASVSVTAAPGATLGAATMSLLVDAGQVFAPAAVTLVQAQPTITSLSPSSIYVGQGAVDVAVNGRNFTGDAVAQVNGTAVATQYQSAVLTRATVANQTLAGNLQVRLRTPDPLNAGQYLTSNEVVLPVLPAQLVVSPSPLTATKGFAKTMTVALPYPAPAGGVTVNLVSSVPSVATVPASATVPEGQTSASFQLSGVETGTTVITASKSGFVSGQAQVTVVPPPTLTLTPNVLTLGVGRTATVTIQSSAAAGPSGVAVALASSDPAIATVPASATIPAGATTTTVTVTTVALGSATITAQAQDYAGGSAAVTVRPVSLNLPTGALVAPGLNRSVPITLSDPAPAGGLVVTLASANTALATVPASITVPEGQTTANFTLTGVAAGATTVSATASGYQSASLPVTVQTVTIAIGTASISIPVNITSPSYAVTLSKPAPAGGVVVNLAVANPTLASVSPSSVTIAEGQTSGGVVTISVTGLVKGSTTLTASAAGLNSASATVTVTGQPDLKISTYGGASAATVGKGLQTYSSELLITRRTDGANYAPNTPLTVTLTSSDPAKVTVPATVTIPAGSYDAYFSVTGVELTNGTPITLDAASSGYIPPATKLPVNVITPTFAFSSLETSRSPASARDDLRVMVTVPGAYFSSNQYAAADMPIDLSVVAANPAGVVDGFYSAATGGTAVTRTTLRAGNNYSDYVYVGVPTAAGSYKVQASVTGGAAVTSGTVTVALPELKFATYGGASTATVGKGLKTYSSEIRVYRSANGVEFSGPSAVTVTLTSSDPAKASVPVTVTIPAGSSDVYFSVTGVDLTNGTPITLDASAAGYTSPVTKLPVNVVAPTFTFSSLETSRSPASARDDLRILVTVPGAYFSGNQYAAADLPIDLSVTAASPAGIVDGFYSAATGGTAVTRTTLRAGNNYSDYVYVGVPTVAGSYKVQASVTGGASATSGLVTVSQPDLKFATYGGASAATVGKGLKTYSSEIRVYRSANGVEFAGSSAVTVTLTSSDPAKASVPATVTIPAGSSDVYFSVTGVDLTNGTPITLDASAAGYTSPVTKLPVNVVAPTFTFSSLETSRSPASARDDLRILVTVPGAYFSGNQYAAADLPIDLSVIAANPAGIVDGFYSAASGGTAVTQTLLRANNNYSDYVYVGVPTAAGSYKVQASVTGGASATSGLVTVSQPDLKIATYGGASTATVGKGLKTYSSEIRVYRSANGVEFAGTSPVTVNLTCNSTAICAVPPTVTIPAGSSDVYFVIEGVGLGNTTITPSASGYNATSDMPVSVIAPKLAFSGPSSSISVGTQSSFYVSLSVPGAYFSGNQTAASPMTVYVTSSAPGVVTVPATVSIATGATRSANANATGVAPGTTTLTASGNSLQTATSGTIAVP